MKPTELSRAKRLALNQLVTQNRLKKVPEDLLKARTFLHQAEENVLELPNIQAFRIRFDVAYNACHCVGEALLAAYGYRTTSGPGQHFVIGEFLSILLTDNAAVKAAVEFDLLRGIRNGSHYHAKQIGRAQADHAMSTAQALLVAVRGILN